MSVVRIDDGQEGQGGGAVQRTGNSVPTASSRGRLVQMRQKMTNAEMSVAMPNNFRARGWDHGTDATCNIRPQSVRGVLALRGLPIVRS